MCDCGKPSAGAATPGHQAHDAHTHAPAAAGTPVMTAPAKADAAEDASCGCGPSASGHHATHAGAATHA